MHVPLVNYQPTNQYSYRLVGNWHPHLVSYVEQVVRAGQLDLSRVSRASAFKVYMLRAGQSNLRMLVQHTLDRLRHRLEITTISKRKYKLLKIFF